MTATRNTIGATSRPHITLKRNQLGQLEAQVLSAEGVLLAQVPIGLAPDGYELGLATIWSRPGNNAGARARDVVLRVLSVKRAHAEHAALGCTA